MLGVSSRLLSPVPQQRGVLQPQPYLVTRETPSSSIAVLRREEGAARQISSLNPRSSTLWAPRSVPFHPRSRRGLQNPAIFHSLTFYDICELGLCRSPDTPATTEGYFMMIIVVNASSSPHWSCPATPRVHGWPGHPGTRVPAAVMPRPSSGSGRRRPPPSPRGAAAPGHRLVLSNPLSLRAGYPRCRRSRQLPKLSERKRPAQTSPGSHLRHAHTSQEAKSHPASPWEVASQFSPLTRTS